MPSSLSIDLMTRAFSNCTFDILINVRVVAKWTHNYTDKLVSATSGKMLVGVCFSCKSVKCLVYPTSPFDEFISFEDPIPSLVPCCDACGRYIIYPRILIPGQSYDLRGNWLIFKEIGKFGSPFEFGERYPVTCMIMDIPAMGHWAYTESHSVDSFVWLFEHGTSSLVRNAHASEILMNEHTICPAMRDIIIMDNSFTTRIQTKYFIEWFKWWHGQVVHPHRMNAQTFTMIQPTRTFGLMSEVGWIDA